MSAPFFSVLVPSYNHAKWLPQALDSLLAQEFTDFEAVVVDDGSVDETPEVLSGYASRDARIRPFRRENGGTAAALNTALERATGGRICWLSSDDLFLPGTLAVFARAAAARPDSRFFYSHFHYLLEDQGRVADPAPWKPEPEEAWQVLEHLHGVYVHGNSICVAREAFAEAGPFKPGYPRAQDYDMWLRLLVRNRASYLPTRTCVTRVHAGQTTHAFPRACFYDSARAAVDFLNGHEFPHLVPGCDLSDPAQAARAAAKLLELASDPACLAYALGPHHGLTGRLAQWAGADPGDPARAAAFAVIREQAPVLAEGLKGTRLGGVLAKTTAMAFPGAWRPVDALALAREWRREGAGGDAGEAELLDRYLRLDEHWRKKT